MSLLPEDQTVAILQRTLDADFRIFPMAETKPSSARIEEIGRSCGVIYPADFLSHVCGEFPGLYVEVLSEVWPRPKAGDVGPFWSFLYAVHSFTGASESSEWMRLDSAAQRFQADTGLTAAPVLRVRGDSNVFCADANGDIVQFDHETNKLENVSLNFWELLEREIVQLRERKERIKSGA